jgi:hypothetical protein
MNTFIFACSAVAGHTEREALMLAKSIRAFGGKYSQSPIWILLPESEVPIVGDTIDRLVSLDIRLVPFKSRLPLTEFPFARKVAAAATAEALAGGHTEFLVWMDSDSLILQEPTPLLLPAGASLGIRPVDHTLIGSVYDQPADPFWDLVYARCGVSPGLVYPVTTTIDRIQIRAYFNAGLIGIRPEKGLFQTWALFFDKLHSDPEFEALFQQNTLYRIFFHQAVLAGAVLSLLRSDEILEYPPQVNYPLHMHTRVPGDQKLSLLYNLVTCRYDTFFEQANWREILSGNGRLISLLERFIEE